MISPADNPTLGECMQAMVDRAADPVAWYDARQNNPFPTITGGYVYGELSHRRYELYMWLGRRYLRDGMTDEVIPLPIPGTSGPCIGGISPQIVEFWRNRS